MSRGAGTPVDRILRVDRVLTGDRGPAVEGVDGAAVRVIGPSVADVGPAGDVLGRAGAGPGDPRVTTFPGATALPGLIDGHVHLAFDASEDPVGALRATDDRTLLADMIRRAEDFVRHGITTVRDLGDRHGLARVVRDRIASGELIGPRVLTSGAPLTPPGGHCWFLGGEARGVAQIRSAVRSAAAAGCDLVKIMVTGGALTPDGPSREELQFDEAEVRAAVVEARRHGLPVAAHAHGADGVALAVRAGVDTVEHFSLGPGTPEARCEELIDAAARAGVAVSPALHGGLEQIARDVDPAELTRLVRLLARQYTRGARLVTGTDAGVPNARPQGYVSALTWFVQAGVSSEDVLVLATGATSTLLGLATRTGRLRPGLDADLLVVEGDPRATLADLDRRLLVLRRGRALRPAPARTPARAS